MHQYHHIHFIVARQGISNKIRINFNLHYAVISTWPCNPHYENMKTKFHHSRQTFAAALLAFQ